MRCDFSTPRILVVTLVLLTAALSSVGQDVKSSDQDSKKDTSSLTADEARLANPVQFTRTDFEAGVEYLEPAVVLIPPCHFDDWNKQINYNYPNGSWINLYHKDDSGVLYSHYIFPSPGSSTGSVKTGTMGATGNFHCVGATPGAELHVGGTAQFKVYPQEEVSSLEFVSGGPTVKGGATARLEIHIANHAHPSGNRVSVSSINQIVVPLSVVVTVTESFDEAFIDVPTNKVTKKTVVRIDAHSSNAKSIFLTVTP
jgi:hypothetical protein